MNAPEFILIVEDCEEAVPALQIALEGFFACLVQHAPDAEHAIRLLNNSATAPLAVVTDLNLPGTSGLELVRTLRESCRWREVPVVVVSADTHPQTPERTRESGADAFFAKPYSPSGLCQSLEKIIHAKHAVRVAGFDPDEPGRTKHS